MAFSSFITTNFGLSLEAKMKAGKKVTVTRVALGDGSIGTSSIYDVIRLKSERFSLPVRSVSYNSTEAIVTALLTNEMLEEGFNLREMGLMAVDPDTNTEGVYLYNRDSGEGEYLPDKYSSQILKEYLRIRCKSSNAANIVFEYNGNPIDVTQEDLEEHNTSAAAHPGMFIPASEKGAAGGVATLDSEGKVFDAQLPDMDYIPTSEKGTAGGVATLDTSGKVHAAQMPDMDYDPSGSAAAVQENLDAAVEDLTAQLSNKANRSEVEVVADAAAAAMSKAEAAIPKVEKGAANGVAPLNINRQVAAEYLPLSSAIDSDSMTEAATSRAVRRAYDKATEATAIVTLRDITVPAAVEQVDIDVSNIDWESILYLVLYAEIAKGSLSVYGRINNISTSNYPTAVASGALMGSYTYLFLIQSSYNYVGHAKFEIYRSANISNNGGRMIAAFGVGGGVDTGKYDIQRGYISIAGDISTINLVANSGTISAGTRFILQGVKK